MAENRVGKHKKGFTLIEVILVLAIAGLILIMVLIALPTLQQGQRNTQRRRDIAMIAALMDKRRANHTGSVSDNYDKRWLSNGFCTFMQHYVPKDMVDPSTGNPYRAALWKTKKSVNCYDETHRDEITRGQDQTAIGRSSDSYWAKMDIGDIQYDDVALCDGETFNDRLGRSAGINAYAFRMYLEGGAVACVDNGMDSLHETSSLDVTPLDPINALGYGSNIRIFTYQ